MQKRKFLITFVAILVISLIGLSATCLAPGEAPTLELEIYDGPDYSESDDMCYYRVEAVATGMPEPEIKFDDDNNVNPLGSGRVEVGAEVGDTYTLTATATNSAGTATVSIILVGECGEEDADADAAVDADADEEVADEEAEEEVADEEAADDEEVAEEEAPEEEEPEEEKEAPTISIEIYEGPTLEGSICYYRIEATVTGSPSPTVSFNKDDSGGAFGTKKAQVNLNNPGDTYSLTATATNSEGTASATMDISWGCAPPEPEITEVDVPVFLPTEGGYIEWGGAITQPHNSIFAGDSTANKICRGFMSYDITGLAGATITDATMTFTPEQVWGDPTFLGSLWVDAIYWGPGALVMADFNITPYIAIESFNSPNITLTNTKLKTELQKAINDGKSRFQIRIRFTTLATDSDNQWDGWDYLMNDIILHVSYTS
ncbi:MAG: hypothetical protein KAI62_04455 [Actinomycetia bacterium]|nr:hypothetical protein [Actinomycetes bacterium]